MFRGAASGLVGQVDLAEAANAVKPGSSAGLLVYDNIWAAPLARAWRVTNPGTVVRQPETAVYLTCCGKLVNSGFTSTVRI